MSEEKVKTQDNLIKIKVFLDTCNEFLTGKFILADIKIAKILKAIAESSDIYDLLAECLINFDFDSEFKKCSYVKTAQGDTFNLPVESYKLIPLVFNILVKLDSKALDLNEFLRDNFAGIFNQNEQYAAFGRTLILPFRDAVADLYSINLQAGEDKPPTDPKKAEDTAKLGLYGRPRAVQQQEVRADGGVVKPEPPANTGGPAAPGRFSEEENCDTDDDEEDDALNADLLFEELKEEARLLLKKAGYVKNENRRENIKLLANALIAACELKDMLILGALILSVNEICKKERVLKENVSNVDEKYAEIIDNKEE